MNRLQYHVTAFGKAVARGDRADWRMAYESAKVMHSGYGASLLATQYQLSDSTVEDRCVTFELALYLCQSHYTVEMLRYKRELHFGHWRTVAKRWRRDNLTSEQVLDCLSEARELTQEELAQLMDDRYRKESVEPEVIRRIRFLEKLIPHLSMPVLLGLSEPQKVIVLQIADYLKRVGELIAQYREAR